MKPLSKNLKGDPNYYLIPSNLGVKEGGGGWRGRDGEKEVVGGGVRRGGGEEGGIPPHERSVEVTSCNFP